MPVSQSWMTAVRRPYTLTARTCRTDDRCAGTRPPAPRPDTSRRNAGRCAQSTGEESARPWWTSIIKRLEQFADWAIRSVFSERDVFEPPAERVIGTNGRVVDAERGVDRGRDVLRPHV